jgi:hypothetical protein
MLVRKHFRTSVTVTKTVTSSTQRHLDTAGSLENSGVGDGSRTLVISLGNLGWWATAQVQNNLGCFSFCETPWNFGSGGALSPIAPISTIIGAKLLF